MTENKGKWASRHRKIEKSGYQAAAKMISFPRRWHGGMISANQEAIWGMSVKTIPGIGAITASALAATVADPHQFTSGRQFATWLGLTPRVNSSGGKARLGGISKMGDQYLRRLLVNGMTSQLPWARLHPDVHPWAAGLLHRKPAKLVAVAMANRAARIAWVVMTRDEIYGAPQPSTREAAA